MGKNSRQLFASYKLIIFFICIAFFYCLQAQIPDAKLLKQKAPKHFKAIFKTTKGDFKIEAYRNWSPLGVDRLYQLIISGFYNNNIILRVEHNYVIQFGISNTPEINSFWYKQKLNDEPIKEKHTRGIVAFARDLPNSRTTQLFINTVDNPKLDTIILEGVKGYTPIGRVISGFSVLTSLNGKYGKKPVIDQDLLFLYGNGIFEKKYPGLDKILSATIIQ